MPLLSILPIRPGSHKRQPQGHRNRKPNRTLLHPAKPGQQPRPHQACPGDDRGLRVGNLTNGAMQAYGFTTLPMNSTVPVGRSRTRNMNGRSNRTFTGLGFADSVCITTPVAAAASVPASSTDTKAL